MIKRSPSPSCLRLSGFSDSQGTGSPGQGRVHCPLCEGVWTPWKVLCCIGPCVSTAQGCHMPTHTYLNAPTNPWAFPVGMLIPSTEIPCLSFVSLKSEIPEGRDLVWFPFDCSVPRLSVLISLERSMLTVTGSEVLDDKSIGWNCSLLWTAGRLGSCPVDGQLLPLPAEGGVVDRTGQPCGPIGLDLNPDTATWSWVWHSPTFALIVKWGCYPKFSRKAVVQLSWDGWKPLSFYINAISSSGHTVGNKHVHFSNTLQFTKVFHKHDYTSQISH